MKDSRKDACRLHGLTMLADNNGFALAPNADKRLVSDKLVMIMASCFTQRWPES